MKRLLAGLIVPVLAASLLAGCNGDGDTKADSAASSSPSPSTPSEQPSGAQSVDPNAPGAGTKYCKLLSTDFATLFANIQGPDDVNQAIAVIRQLADEAPPAVKDDWGVMRGALGQMKGALTKAAALQKKASEGKVSQKKLQQETAKLMQQMKSLDTPRNNQAGDAVAKHASEYCGIKIG